MKFRFTYAFQAAFCVVFVRAAAELIQNRWAATADSHVTKSLASELQRQLLDIHCKIQEFYPAN